MQKTIKKTISIVLSLVMLLSVFGGLTFTASAATVVETGSCGDSATYTLDSDGLLTISGSGQVAGDLFVDRTDIRKVVIEEGITGLSMRTFKSCNFEEISLPDSLTSYDTYSFWACSNFETLVFPRGITAIDHYFCYECTGLKTLIIMAEDLTMFKGFTLNMIPSVETVKFAGSEEQCGQFVDDYFFRNITVEYDYAPVNVGDIIEFGGYPQSQVTDTDVVSQLDALVENAEWISYDYYSGDGNYGSMQPGDWMKYCDIELNDTIYRGVRFTRYRPYYIYSSNTGSSTSTYQDDNGYYTNTTYWFKWESLVWRVLDPAAGLVLCENIIDSQAYSNTIYYLNKNYYNEPTGSVYANDYESSSIRQWLINDFYNTAFSASEQANIAFTPLDNSAYSSQYNSNPTNDKIFLLSWNDVLNTSYGFSSSYGSNPARQASGSDYAKCQGLYEFSETAKSNWLSRSAGNYSYLACYVYYDGYASRNNVYGTHLGVRPAFKFSSGIIIQSSNPNGGCTSAVTVCEHANVQVVDPIPATCTTDGNTGYTICLDCGEIISGENTVIPATGHAYVNHEAKAPTCTEIGWAAYRTCENCDYSEYVEIPASGHTYVNHDAQAPTCTEIGWEAYRTCENCDYTTYVEIPANGHSYVNHDAKAPTCTEIGWEAYRTCENCDYTEYVEIPANGHAYVNHDAKAPTCTEIGWEAYRTCENCDYTTYVEIPATDHDYRFDSFVWAADNTAKAKLVCANDADHVKLVDATVTSETTAPTATEDGFTVYTATYEGRSEEKTVVDEGSATGEVTPSDDPSTPTDGEKIHGEHCFCYNVSEDSTYGSLIHFLCGIICALITFLSTLGVA